MEEKKPEEKKLEICPCCGKPTLEPDKVQLSNQVIDQYLACVITGEAFARDYYLYRDKMKIRITSLSDQILDKMNLLTSKFNFIQDDALKDAYQLFISRLFTFLPVVSISIKKDGEEQTKDIQAVVKPLLQDAMQHFKDVEWLTKTYKMLLDPALVFSIPKNVLNDVVAGHLKIQKFLEAQNTPQNFFQGIVQA